MCVLGLAQCFSPQPKPLAHIGWQSPKKEAILTIAEHDRWLLHNRLRDVIGSQEADILMEHLPPAGWNHLATKQDLELTTALLRQDLQSEISGFRQELKTEISQVRQELKTEISAVRVELKTEISAVRVELKTEISEVRQELKTEIAELRVEMERGFRSQTWKMVTSMIATQSISVAIMASMVNSLR
ncbi:MAG: hypothetical protein RL691_570 [Actinomycetota bacterium]|jgi:hypothetical protein